jgi:class I fructose-bisphosphate aldolase
LEPWRCGRGCNNLLWIEESTRQIIEVYQAFERAHELAWLQFSVLPSQQCVQKGWRDYHVAADLTGQANHLGVTLQADIIKQKAPENNGGFKAIGLEKPAIRFYSSFLRHPIDLTRYQVVNCYNGRAGLINSGGASSGSRDLAEAVFTAVVN